MNKAKNEKETTGHENEKAGKPMDSPAEVQQSSDEKIDEDFPGYPHYPAKDDILRKENNGGEVDMDVENLSRSGKQVVTPNNNKQGLENTADSEDNSERDNNGEISENDVTDEDLAVLGPKNGDQDMGEDEELGLTGDKIVTGKELDIPGSELDDDNEDIGEEDEENNYYSLGGDGKDSLEEDPTAR